jgi:predicted MFS family arabinose efflux permease
VTAAATPESARAWSARLLALSLAASIAVSIIYLPQSLITNLAGSLGVSPGVASIVATTVQAGYAVGIVLFVPLADRLHPKRQVTIQSLILASALVVAAAMPEIVSVAIAFLAVGLVANIAQVIIPAANRLSPEARRGSTTGTLVGAILVGIFGGRIIASLFVQAIGWRFVILIFSALVLAVLPFVRRALDADFPLPPGRRSYLRLLGATFGLIRSPSVVQSAVIQFFAFATFNSLWTVMVLQLTGPDFGWSVLAAGLFGLVGLTAGIVTPIGGRFVDRFGPLPVAGVFLGMLFVATLAVVVDAAAIVPFGLSMFVVTWANQSIQSANQSRVLVTNLGRAAQANTLFMFCVFFGGSVGAFLGPIAFAAGGMPLVAIQGASFTLVAGAAWLYALSRERRASVPQAATLKP